MPFFSGEVSVTVSGEVSAAVSAARSGVYYQDWAGGRHALVSVGLDGDRGWERREEGKRRAKRTKRRRIDTVGRATGWRDEGLARKRAAARGVGVGHLKGHAGKPDTES